MLSVSVHKDIGEYTEKVVGKLSARTLACTAGGLASAVAAAAVAKPRPRHPGRRHDLPVMAASMPFSAPRVLAAEGVFPPERFLPLVASHALGDGKIAYTTGSRPGLDSGPRRLR